MSAQRSALPAADFAAGKGHYPIEDKTHARLALAMASKHPSEAAGIKAKVHAKYPDIGDESSGSLGGLHKAMTKRG